MSLLGSLDGLRRDTRAACRSVRKSIGFTSLVVLSLGLGIGATTAIFTLIDGLLFKALHIDRPDTLVQITTVTQGPTLNNVSYPAFELLHEADLRLTGLFGWNRTRFVVEQNGTVQALDGAYVTGAYYDTLGIRPVLGRLLDENDQHLSSASGGPVATIGYSYWQRTFDGSPSVIGKTLTIRGIPFTIVGVQPEGFHGLEMGASVDITVPVTAEQLMLGRSSMLHVRDAKWLKLFARLPARVPEANVRAQLRVLAPHMFEQVVPPSMSGQERQQFLSQQLDFVPAGTGLSDLRPRFQRPLSVLLAIVALVTLMACVNIANLLLMRATARRGEVAVRFALGGSRFDVIRPLLLEGVLFSLMGAALGLLISLWGSRLALALMAPSLGGIVLDIDVDRRILLFTAGMAALAATIFALAPALTVGRVDLGGTLKQNAAAVRSAGGSRWTLRRALVVCQVVISLQLLVSAGLFVQSLRNLQTLDLGLTRENLLIVGTALRSRDVENTTILALYTELLERLKIMPGVRLVSAARFAPVEGSGFTLRVRPPGASDTSAADEVHVNAVGPKFFETIGMRLLKGRDIDERDVEHSPTVGVINDTLARRYFPHRNPIGEHLLVGGINVENVEIVGIVEDAHYAGPRSEVPATVFTAFLQSVVRPAALNLLIRTDDRTGSVASAIRREAGSDSGPLRVTNILTLDEKVDRTLGQDRLLASLSSSFAWLALLMVSVGLYGVMAYTAALRTGEIGLRMALGAGRWDIMWLVMRETFWLVLIGIVIGAPLAMLATRSLSSLLFGIGAQGTIVLAIGGLVMFAVAAIAAAIPARHAARIDPVLALRAE